MLKFTTSVAFVGLVIFGIWSCKDINPKIDTVTGDGDTKVEKVEVGTVGGSGGTTNVDTVNANIGMGGLLGNPYTIVKTSQAAGCRDEQACRCIISPIKTGILAPRENTFYIAKMNSSRTMFGCIMNSRVINDASKYQVSIQVLGGGLVPSSPMGSAKSLEELNSLIK
jgi:hypothetical protein